MLPCVKTWKEQSGNGHDDTDHHVLCSQNTAVTVYIAQDRMQAKEGCILKAATYPVHQQALLLVMLL